MSDNVEVKAVSITLEVPLRQIFETLTLQGERLRWFNTAKRMIFAMHVAEFAKVADLDAPVIYRNIEKYAVKRAGIAIQSTQLLLKPIDDWTEDKVDETLNKWQKLIEAAAATGAPISTPG